MNHIHKLGLLAKRNLLICITLITLFFIDSSVGQQVAYAQLPQPYLVQDINTRTLRSDPVGFIGVNDIIYFAADDGIHGSELWRTDGTATGTWLVKDLLPGWQGSSPEQIQADQQGNIYFLTRTPDSNSRGLWKSNGTAAGTQELIRGNMVWVTALNGHAFFSQFSLETGEELWITDGTVAGTKLLKDINPGPASSNASCGLRIKATLYCYANDGVHGHEWWRTDGTPQGTLLVKDINPDNGADVLTNATERDGAQQTSSTAFRPIAILGDFFYFSAYTPATGWELWQSNGTAEGTALVKDLLPGPTSSSPESFVAAPHLVYFTIHRDTDLSEIWRTDGTAEGTYKLSNGSAYEAAAVGDTLFFSGCCPAGDAELWLSDGTAAGTHLVKAITPGPQPSLPSELVTVGNKVYFFAQDEAHGTELWVSDGTADGTQLVKDLLPGPASSAPAFGVTGYGLVAIEGLLYFRAIDSNAGYELWKSDGTAAGTAVVKDIHSSHNGSSLISDMTPVGEALYFVANDNAGQSTLWKTNATATAVEPILKLGQVEGSLSNFAAMSDNLYLLTRTATDLALVQIRGTQTTTIPLLTPPGQEGNGGSYPLVTIDHRLFLIAVYNGRNEAGELIAQDEVLWVSDGTSSGTQIIKHLPAPTFQAQRTVIFQDQLYFVAAATADPTQLALWRSDGTSDGTTEIKVVPFDRFSSLPPYFAVARGQLFFVALDDSSDQSALWRSDGTSDGTTAAAPLQTGRCNHFTGFTVYQGNLYFCNYDEAHGAELWQSNGTAAGTALFKDINPGSASSQPELLWADTTQLYLRATDETHGRELWQSEGTSASTRLLVDLTPGQNSSAIGSAAAWHGQLYFTANHAPIPEERLMLWRTDGTPAGTQSLAQVGNDASLTTTSSTFFFIGYTPATGEELWTLNATFNQYSFLPFAGQ